MTMKGFRRLTGSISPVSASSAGRITDGAADGGADAALAARGNAATTPTMVISSGAASRAANRAPRITTCILRDGPELPAVVGVPPPEEEAVAGGEDRPRVAAPRY